MAEPQPAQNGTRSSHAEARVGKNFHDKDLEGKGPVEKGYAGIEEAEEAGLEGDAADEASDEDPKAEAPVKGQSQQPKLDPEQKPDLDQKAVPDVDPANNPAKPQVKEESGTGQNPAGGPKGDVDQKGRKHRQKSSSDGQEEQGEDKKGEGEKSDPNLFKGMAYSYYVPASLVSLGHHSPARSQYKNIQYGSSFSGPLVKDRLFFYFASEAQRKRSPRRHQYSKDDYTNFYGGMEWSANSENTFDFQSIYNEYDGGKYPMPNVDGKGKWDKGQAYSHQLKWGSQLGADWRNEVRVRLSRDQNRNADPQCGAYRMNLGQFVEEIGYNTDAVSWKFGIDNIYSTIDNHFPFKAAEAGKFDGELSYFYPPLREVKFSTALWQGDIHQTSLYAQTGYRFGSDLKVDLSLRWTTQTGRSVSKGYIINDIFARRTKNAHDHKVTYALTGEWRPRFDDGRSKVRMDIGRYLNLDGPPPVSEIPPLEFFSYDIDNLSILAADRVGFMWERTTDKLTTVLSYAYLRAPNPSFYSTPATRNLYQTYTGSVGYLKDTDPFSAQLAYTLSNSSELEEIIHFDSGTGEQTGIGFSDSRKRNHSLNVTLNFLDKNRSGIKSYISATRVWEISSCPDGFKPLQAGKGGPKGLICREAEAPSGEDDPKEKDLPPDGGKEKKSGRFSIDVGAYRDFNLSKKVKLTTSVDIKNALNAKSNRPEESGGKSKKDKEKALESRTVQFGLKVTF